MAELSAEVTLDEVKVGGRFVFANILYMKLAENRQLPNGCSVLELDAGRNSKVEFYLGHYVVVPITIGGN